jgi:enoyl-CoA hydratase
MAELPVSLDRSDGVATITLANPPRHTLTAEGVQQLHVALDELEGDGQLRAVVLTGGGAGVFVAHYEVGELADSAAKQTGAEPAADRETRLHPFHTLCLRLEALPAVTVAALNGNAAGGGCEPSLACDFRLMADGPFHYGLPETSVGIIPGAGGTQCFERTMRSKDAAGAMRAWLEGRPYTWRGE